MSLDVTRPDGTGVVGAAINGGDGWLIEGTVYGEACWAKGVLHVVGMTLPVWTKTRAEAAWWTTAAGARAWAVEHLEATRGGQYDVIRTKFPTGFRG